MLSASNVSPEVYIGGGHEVSEKTGARVWADHTTYGRKAGALKFGNLPLEFAAGRVKGAFIEISPKLARNLPRADNDLHLDLK